MMQAFPDVDFEADALDIAAALRTLERRGLVIVRGAVRPALANVLHGRLLRDTHQVAQREGDRPWRIREDFLGSRGHIGILPALSEAVILRDILAPRGIFEIIQSYLGRDFYLHEWVDNINLARNPHEQKAHRDEEIDALGRVCGVVLNLAVQPTGPANGVTAFWLDSHWADFRQDDDPSGAGLAFPEYRPILAAGDLIVRDLALLHKGVANPDDVDRHLGSLVFNPAWQPMNPRLVRGVPPQEKLAMPEDLAHLLRHHDAADAEGLAACSYPIPEMAG